ITLIFIAKSRQRMQMMYQLKQLLSLHIRIHLIILDYQLLFLFTLKNTLLLKIKVGNEELSHKITPHMTMPQTERESNIVSSVQSFKRVSPYFSNCAGLRQ